MQCFGSYCVDDKKIVGECPDCGADINKEGEAVEDNCSYSPVDCETCEDQPCNGAC